ncbi:hypothetical protein DRJ73_14670, partial [Enterococcus faecalis]
RHRPVQRRSQIFISHNWLVQFSRGASLAGSVATEAGFGASLAGSVASEAPPCNGGTAVATEAPTVATEGANFHISQLARAIFLKF